ncbi:hypothetical protein QTP86_016488 [Hemibagrus guttatus]|nr:hypothetical protein QTP86_016488 [Hemibagrus guttatus]
MDSLPSGWEMIGMDLVAGITEGITTLIHGVTSIGSLIFAPQKLFQTKGQESNADCFDEINIYSKSAEILRWTEKIHEFVKENTINWKDLYDQKHKIKKTKFQADQFNRIGESLIKSPDCKAKEEALNLCNKGIEICEELAKYAPEEKCDEAKTTELIELIRKLNESARSFDSKSKAVTKSPALTPKPPMMEKEESKSGKASERASQNARFRIEQSRAQLDKTREMYEKSVENMEKNQKELTEILITMRNCEVKEIDFNTTIEMLVKGMDAMGRVKEQWEKMVHFFQMVSNIVKIQLTRTLKDFVSTSEKTQKLSYDTKLLSKDLIYSQAFQASNIASLVNMISTTYTEVSTKHLMDRVSSLGKLMAMDKEKPGFLSGGGAQLQIPAWKVGKMKGVAPGFPACGVHVRDGGGRDSNDFFSCPHYSLQGLAIRDGAIPKPGSEAAAQDALDGREMGFPQPPQEAEVLLVMELVLSD